MVFIQVERGVFFGTEISFNDFLNNKIVVWGIVKPNEVEDRVLRLRVANSVRIEMRSAHFLRNYREYPSGIWEVFFSLQI